MIRAGGGLDCPLTASFVLPKGAPPLREMINTLVERMRDCDIARRAGLLARPSRSTWQSGRVSSRSSIAGSVWERLGPVWGCSSLPRGAGAAASCRSTKSSQCATRFRRHIAMPELVLGTAGQDRCRQLPPTRHSTAQGVGPRLAPPAWSTSLDGRGAHEAEPQLSTQSVRWACLRSSRTGLSWPPTCQARWSRLPSNMAFECSFLPGRATSSAGVGVPISRTALPLLPTMPLSSWSGDIGIAGIRLCRSGRFADSCCNLPTDSPPLRPHRVGAAIVLIVRAAVRFSLARRLKTP